MVLKGDQQLGELQSVNSVPRQTDDVCDEEFSPTDKKLVSVTVQQFHLCIVDVSQRDSLIGVTCNISQSGGLIHITRDISRVTV